MKRKVTATAVLLLSLFTLQSQVSKKKSQKELNNILGANEAKAINDQVFADDVIIEGSLCVGLDCVNGESFGFDTERLKENNLRIHFNDTSNSGSFPTNDWRIVANETTNGGDNFLAFEDSDAGTYPFKVQSGAGNNALFVERGGGNIGFGTSNPAVELHSVDGDSPTLRLEQNGSSGFTPQTWDIAGNETNFFIRDVTNGSRLPFRIRPGAPTSSIDIKSNVVEIKNVALFDPSSPSDIRLKEGIVVLKDATEVLTKLQPKSFFYNQKAIDQFDFSDKKHFGLVAQEVQKVLPEVVKKLPIGEKNEEYLTVKYEALIPFLIQGFKEQQATIDAQNKRIKELEKGLASYASLESRIRAIEEGSKHSSAKNNAKR